MKHTIIFLSIFLSNLLMADAASKVNCKFLTYDTSNTQKNNKVLAYTIEDGKGVSATVGPYTIFIKSASNKLEYGVSLSSTSSSVNAIDVADVDALPANKALGGTTAFTHAPASGYARVKYGCQKAQ